MGLYVDYNNNNNKPHAAVALFGKSFSWLSIWAVFGGMRIGGEHENSRR